MDLVEAAGEDEAAGAWVANAGAEHRLAIALEGEAIKRCGYVYLYII